MKMELNINANMLIWAIARAGYDREEFVAKAPNVQLWIKGEKKPTVKQLETFSKKVHLPFGYLFLPNPPEEKLPIPFFRTNNPQPTGVSVNVYDTILLMQQRQDWLKEYLKDNDFKPISFIGKFRNQPNVAAIVHDIRNTLGLHENWASQCAAWTDALEKLTRKIEEAGIISVFNGVVENNTRRPINVDECRGFVLADDYAPFMFINNSDGKAAQMFTIVHELAHLWSGHSAGFDFRKLRPADDPTEILCDKVAAEFLVPQNAFNEVWQRRASIKYCSRFFKASEIVIARRALDTGKISLQDFYNFYDEYAKREFIKKEKQAGGGDFYAAARKRLNMTFASHVNRAVKTGKLLYRDAYRLTGLKGDAYQTFFAQHFLS